MEALVIVLVVKVVVQNELVFGHFNIGRGLFVVDINDPGQFEQETQFVYAFAVLYFVLTLSAVDEVEGLT